MGGIFLEREVKEEKTTEKILPYEVCEEITETDIESSNIPTFKQLSQSVSEKYCEYKYKERKKRMKSRLIMLELIYICAFDTVMEEWETYYRLNIIGILVVAAIITPILVPKLFERKNQELKASMSCVGEYVVVKERFYEKIKLRCSDGRIIRYQMKTDDKDELDNGEDAVIVYFPESEQIYLERLKEWNKLFL